MSTTTTTTARRPSPREALARLTGPLEAELATVRAQIDQLLAAEHRQRQALDQLRQALDDLHARPAAPALARVPVRRG
jgi:hypothetical protein